MKRYGIIQADVLDGLAQLETGSVQTVVTSPPYFGLRDYGEPGQFGQEATLDEYVENMAVVFREVRRVLKLDGTVWLNLGDSYTGSWGAQGQQTAPKGRLSARQIEAAFKRTANTGSLSRTPGLKRKELMGVPWRIAFALQASGWHLRQDIIWAKPNAMPESVKDRCVKAHEYIFLPEQHGDVLLRFRCIQRARHIGPCGVAEG